MTTVLGWIEARNGIMFAVRISEEMILQGIEDDGSLEWRDSGWISDEWLDIGRERVQIFEEH